ncbi:MAG: superoxide dismutase, Ni [Patescibacteria group bacterium]
MTKQQILNFLIKHLPHEIAYAHCDIPCGIYDPHAAQVGAHTVIRMTQLLSELKREDETKAEHDIARMTHVKEEHGSLIEDELGTLENDYFKEEHFKDYPELKKLIADAVKLSIKTRQTIDMISAEQLLEAVLKIAEIFYKTKNLEPIRVKSPYPTEREIVVYK